MNLPLPNDLTTSEGLDEVRWMAPEVVSPATFSEESGVQEEEMTSAPHKVTWASDVHSFGMTALEVRSLLYILRIALLKFTRYLLTVLRSHTANIHLESSWT